MLLIATSKKIFKKFFLVNSRKSYLKKRKLIWAHRSEVDFLDYKTDRLIRQPDIQIDALGGKTDKVGNHSDRKRQTAA